MFPYLDLIGFKARTSIPGSDIDLIESLQPGFTAQRIASWTSWINGRLRKRYGSTGNANALPLGQWPPAVDAAGTSPPAVTLTGRPTLGCVELVMAILTAGALGASTFWWSDDHGETWTIGPQLASAGTTPPAVGVSGAAAIKAPSSLVLDVTTGGALGAARYQWSADGGASWSISGVMASSGTTPPQVTLSGTSALSLPSKLQIQITTLGPVGTAIFRWSLDGGVTWTTGLATSLQPIALGATGLSATFSAGNYAVDNAYVGQGLTTSAAAVLGATGLTASFGAGTYATDNVYTGQGITTAPTVGLAYGLTAVFPVGNYATDNVYTSPTPVPEVVLGWLTDLVSLDVYDRRGANAQDPTLVRLAATVERVQTEVKEAADGDTGLFDLPTNDDTDSAITTGGPQFYSETSPYVSADREACIARSEDARGRGTS